MKNINKLFEKKIELKNSQISGGRALGETYKNVNHTYTDQHGCTVTDAQVRTDGNVLVEECFFTNCP
ncbi:hypothetical protein [Pedobacter soli]|uniref:Uncharacterized protein n=1 Tax=Pedobacter soli TaxID=390242 RepID=A0A1G6WTX4_9SPHI|nr:hypothetical protein [Pedobacter soli]SDD68536.1 hypothetical protein SAMN04488024_107104 [Pedobacter soli]